MELKKTEKLEKSIVALTIEISAAEIEAAKEKAFKKNGKNITVPGFRKGKAPRKVIEKLYGEGVFFEDALNICYPEAFDAAVAEAALKQVGQADVNIEDMHDDGSVVLVCKVPVEPEVELSAYKGLSAENETVRILAADVNAEIERMAQRNSSIATVERAAKNGDTVILDYAGSVDGVAFEGGTAEKQQLKLGSGTFIPGFEDQLVGVKAGESKDVVVTFPTEYHAAELAGKEAVFACTVHEVKETVLPAIDDEFAKDVSETAETLEDLKKEVKERLSEQRNQAVDRQYEEDILTALIGNMTADIPDAMIEAQVDNLVQDFAYRLQMQGMNLDQYVKMIGAEMGGFRAMFNEQAERQVKVRLALRKVIELEGIEVSEADIEAKYSELAEQYKMDLEQVKKVLPVEAMIEDLMMDKAMACVKDSSKPVKKSKKKDEEAKEEAAE